MDMSNRRSDSNLQPRSGPEVAYEVVGRPIRDAEQVIVWAHGWGQSRDALRALASSFPHSANLLLDFPGFGASPPPPEAWGTAEYADATAALLRNATAGQGLVWVGHSFGCRVGIQLAARHPLLLNAMCLIAAAGIPRQRSLLERMQVSARIASFKIAKRLPRMFIGDAEQLRARFGSADYRAAGEMRGTFLRVIRENLTDIARSVTCRCLLIYGAQDTETPPELGDRFSRLIPQSTLNTLPNQDHYTVLTSGRHIVAKRIQQFLERP